MSHPAAPDGSGTPPGRSGIEVAVPEPSTTDPVLLGGAGGAIRPTPVGGAIRPITNNKAHDEAAKNAVLA